MRLTKRSNKTVHENGVCCTYYLSKECEERSGYCTDECPWEEAVWSKLADYEDAEEQGLLLRLPCKVGDTIYVNLPFGNARKTYEREVEGFGTCGGIWMIETKNFDYPFSCIGTTAFLTKEKAEAALAEKSGAE